MHEIMNNAEQIQVSLITFPPVGVLESLDVAFLFVFSIALCELIFCCLEQTQIPFAAGGKTCLFGFYMNIIQVLSAIN